MKDHPLTSFSDLHLAEPILKALAGEGYSNPTPIQAKAIPPVMEGRNLLGIAQTGTGKTAAFALPILHRLAADPRPAPRRGCRVLVLSPTRELCSQIGESFRTYGRHLGITVSVVFGGVAHRPQIQALSRGVDVLVAAPGRLLDLMEQRAADLSGTEIFVLDEADQMLDLGFVKPIRRIVSQLSHRRQNLFFSATMPTEIAGLADELLQDPVKVSVAPVATTAERVDQRVILVEAGKKRALLTELLANSEMTRTLVFTRTKRGADRVARHLEAAKITAAAIHGNKSQRQREFALEDFKRSRIRVLVATDIAARGIDIDLVTHVVNYELPEVPEAYVHRIGRTARAGASGTAISLCDAEERDLLRAIERLTRQQIPHEDRRNDASIVVEATPKHADDGQRTEGRHRGHRGRPERSGEHRARGERRDGQSGHRRDGEGRRPEHRGDRDRPARAGDRPQRDAQPHAHEPRHRDGHSVREGQHGGAERRERPDHRAADRGPHRHGGENRRPHADRVHGDRPRGEHRPHREGGQRHQSHGHRSDNSGESLHSVGFLKRPHDGERRHDGEQRPQAHRAHGDRERGSRNHSGGGHERPRRPGSDRDQGSPRHRRDAS